jgi:hypothetical protein
MNFDVVKVMDVEDKYLSYSSKLKNVRDQAIEMLKPLRSKTVTIEVDSDNILEIRTWIRHNDYLVYSPTTLGKYKDLIVTNIRQQQRREKLAKFIDIYSNIKSYDFTLTEPLQLSIKVKEKKGKEVQISINGLKWTDGSVYYTDKNDKLLHYNDDKDPITIKLFGDQQFITALSNLLDKVTAELDRINEHNQRYLDLLIQEFKLQLQSPEGKWIYKSTAKKVFNLTDYQIEQAINANIIRAREVKNPYYSKASATLLAFHDIQSNLELISSLPKYSKDDLRARQYYRERSKKRELIRFLCPRCKEYIKPLRGSYAFEWFVTGQITQEEATRMLMITHYRHKHTDYRKEVVKVNNKRYQRYIQYRDKGFDFELAWMMVDESEDLDDPEAIKEYYTNKAIELLKEDKML